MQALSTFFQQRRQLSKPLASTPKTCTIRIKVDVGSLSALRQIVMRVCGDALAFMRIASNAWDGQIYVWLCVQAPFAALLSATITKQLPEAQLLPQPRVRGSIA